MAKEALHLQGRLPSPALRLPLVRAEEAEFAALTTANFDRLFGKAAG